MYMKNLDLTEASQYILKIHEVKNVQTSTSVAHVLSQAERDLWISGTQHTQDINDSQISILEKKFTNFLNQNYKNPILCLEGSLPDEIKDKEDAVQKYGEKAILILMAQKHGMRIVSVEPSQAEISEWAMQIFPQPLVHAAWATLNILSRSPESLEKSLPKISTTYGFKESPEELFEQISDYLREQQIIEIPNHLEQLSKRVINKEKTHKGQEPGDGPFPTNEAGSAINLARDYGLFINTIKILEENKNDGVFAWFGLNHVLAMMPAFEMKGYKKIPAHY